MSSSASAIYLDHNATTPVDPAVFEALSPYLQAAFGNPSSIDHTHGLEAQRAVEHARRQVAETIGARAVEVVFTGGCTESNNLALIGAAKAHQDRRHLITSAVEHPSVLEPLRALEREGWRLTVLPVDGFGRVAPDAVAAAVETDTLLVSIQAANNEVGTLQPLAAIGEICAARDILFHSDLAQIAAHGEIDVERLGLHMASLSGHKAYGPKGVGALYLRSRRPRVRVAPLVHGGGQERGIRPGTLNTPAIVGMGAALEIARHRRAADSERLRNLCQDFHHGLIAQVDGVDLNGHPTERLPNNLALSIQGVEPLALIRRLNDRISFSASSACASDKVETSPVLIAMFGDSERARRAFRIAPGRFTTQDEMTTALAAFVEAVECLRGATRSAA